MRTRATFLIVLLLTLGVSAKHRPAPVGISLSPSAWDVRYSSGVKLQALSGMAGWWLQFPGAGGSVNYVTTPYAKAIQQGQFLTFSVQIVVVSGAPVFNYQLEPWNTCDYPAHVRAYIEQQAPKGCPDATYTCAPPTARWWANPLAVELAPGAATVSVPVHPSQWSDAEGQMGTDALDVFGAALAHPAAVGLTFGGGCFYGHGVNVLDGTARLILTAYTIQP